MHWPNAALTLVHRVPCWPNVETACCFCCGAATNWNLQLLKIGAFTELCSTDLKTFLSQIMFNDRMLPMINQTTWADMWKPTPSYWWQNTHTHSVLWFSLWDVYRYQLISHSTTVSTCRLSKMYGGYVFCDMIMGENINVAHFSCDIGKYSTCPINKVFA